MLRSHLAELVRRAVASLVESGRLPESALSVPVEIQDTKQPEHGDFACNLALVASKVCGMPPRSIAELLRDSLFAIAGTNQPAATGESDSRTPNTEHQTPLAVVDIAGPGFLNLRLDTAFIASYVHKIIELGESLPNTATPQHRNTATRPRLNVEFVSVNPNGPITVGSGRGAAFGDTLCRVFEAAGNEAYREFYVNDGVNSEQMRLFAESVRSYVHGKPLPESGYKGDYVVDVAREVAASISHGLGTVTTLRLDWFQRQSQNYMIAAQRGDLAVFGVEFDRWFSEQTLHDEGKVTAAIEKLKANGAADDEPYRMETPRDDPERGLVRVEQPPGAVWLRSTRYGDDQDRVLIREDGRPAYIAADVAYLESKLGERGFDKAYMILGPDHHGYIGRIYAMYEALGYPMKDGKPERLEIVIFQIVRFVKDGKPAPMRKRDGNIYELRDLIDELGAAVAPKASEEERQRIGRDVARFFYLMRSHETHMDFDIDLATKQSEENPVFYAQYAHARICSVIRKAEEAGVTVLGRYGIAEGGQRRNTETPQHQLLTHPKELALIKKIVDLPHEVQRCAEDYGVHRLTTYAVDLARTYHLFYDACRVIQPDQLELTQARLALCEAARIALKATFDLLGISAPERMERETTAEGEIHEGAG